MKIALAALIVLSSTCFLGTWSFCDRIGPGICFSTRLTCPWTHSLGWSDHYDKSYNNYYFGLSKNHKTTETIESRTVCSTKNKIHCLNFQYSFEENNVLDLRVFVRSTLGEREVWKMSSSTTSFTWDGASVPVNTNTDFQLMFEARGPRDDRVFIDRVHYVKQACDITPTAATPSPVTDPVMTTLTTTVKPFPTLPTVKSSTTVPKVESSTTVPKVESSTTVPKVESSTNKYRVHTSDSTHSGDVPTTPSQTGKTAPGGSSSHLGLIVGGVVAAVCLILIGLVLAILLKRKRRGKRRKSFRRQKHREEELQVTASYNAAYSPEETAPGPFVSVNVNPVIPQSNLQPHEQSRIVNPSLVNNYYSVDDATHLGPSVKAYNNAEGTKRRKSHDGQRQRPLQHSDESPYEIGDSIENIPPIPPPASPEDDYNTLNFHSGSYSGHRDRPVPSTDQYNDDSHLPFKKTKAPPSSARDKGPGLYQNPDTGWQIADQQAASSLYQNVTGCPGTHQHRTGLPHLPQQDSDLAGEDPPADVCTLPEGTTSDQGDKQNHPVPECHDTENIYHVLEEQAPSTLYPDSPDTSSNAIDYQHLDFEGNRATQRKGDNDSAPVYSHLHGWDESDYHQIDRGRRREVIDGDYSHV